VALVFPYLNAVVPNIMYNPGANTVTIKRAGRLLTFYPTRGGHGQDRRRGGRRSQLQWFRELCNDTWQRRGEIMPCYERRSQLGRWTFTNCCPG